MRRSLFKAGFALVTCALLAPIPAIAKEVKIQATAQFLDYLVGDVVCVSGSGQLSLRGNVHQAKFTSDDSRVTGMAQAVNLNTTVNSDGSATFSGRLWLEVGTFDAVTGNFTRNDGVWEIDYGGILNADGSVEFTKMTGRGIGGSVDGLHLTATAVGAPPSPTNPRPPYLGNGKITGPNA
jgi:hypothetical protein